jgi:hypothetical protein
LVSTSKEYIPLQQIREVYKEIDKRLNVYLMTSVRRYFISVKSKSQVKKIDKAIKAITDSEQLKRYQQEFIYKKESTSPRLITEVMDLVDSILGDQ